MMAGCSAAGLPLPSVRGLTAATGDLTAGSLAPPLSGVAALSHSSVPSVRGLTAATGDLTAGALAPPLSGVTALAHPSVVHPSVVHPSVVRGSAAATGDLAVPAAVAAPPPFDSLAVHDAVMAIGDSTADLAAPLSSTELPSPTAMVVDGDALGDAAGGGAADDGAAGEDAALDEVPRVDISLAESSPMVLLLIVSLAAPATLLMPAGGDGPQLAFGTLDDPAEASAGSRRKSAMKLATGWLSAATGVLRHAQALLVGDTLEGHRVVVAPTQLVPPRDAIATTPADAALRRAFAPRGTVLFLTLAALAGSALFSPASLAMAKCSALIRPTAGFGDPGTLRMGAMTLRPLIPRSSVTDDGSGPNVAQALELCRQGDQALRRLLDVPPGHPEHEFLRASIDRVGACDLSELWADDSLLKSRAPGFGAADLALAPFSPVIQPPRTDYHDPPGVGASKLTRQPDHCYETIFSAPPELLEGWCLDALQDWLLLLEADVVVIAEQDFEARTERPQPFVAGQDCFVPAARGCIWDLRRAAEGIIVPLNFAERIHSQLDVQYVEDALPGWPDQRMLAYLHEGVHFEFDMPLQIVLHAHLFSAWHGFASLQKEARRLQGHSYETQWSQIFARFPLLPLWILAHGATARKLEPDRWRSTTEGGAPRNLLLDTEGVPVRSINERSREYPHPAEEKPTPAQGAQDIAVLDSGSAAAMRACTDHASATERPPGELLVFIATDDVADYFMHLATRPELWWYSAYVVLAKLGDPDLDVGTRLRFVVEYSLSFGIVCSSGYAQRFSTLILALVEVELQALLEEEWPDWRQDACFRDWLDQRELHLGLPHARLHSTKMYTDDAALAASSAEMFVLLLRAWHRATTKLNLRMAIAAKRFLGTSAMWLGVGFVAAVGILFIPKSKILRALEALRNLRVAKLTVQLTLSLLGLLEHFRGVLFGPREWMFGLWILASDRQHPAAMAEPDDFARRNIDRWMARLQEGGAVSTLSAFARRALSGEGAARAELRTLSPALVLHLWPDAARQHLVVDRRGMGAWGEGFAFAVPIPPLGMQLLAISILELLAALLSLLTLGAIAPQLEIHLHTDSLTSFFVLADESANTPEGQLAMERFLALPEAAQLRERTQVDHTYGEGNIGDLPSRGKWRELYALAAQLGVRVRHTAVPEAGIQLVCDVLVFAGRRRRVEETALLELCSEVRRLSELESMRGRHRRNQDAGDGPSALERASISLAAGLGPAQRAHGGDNSAPTLAAMPPPATALARAAQALAAGTPTATTGAAHPRMEMAARQPGKSAIPPDANARAPGMPGALRGERRVTIEQLLERRRGASTETGLGKGVYALRPVDDGILPRMQQELRGLHMEAQNERTLAKDMGHWNLYWEPICALFNTSSIRDAPGAATGTDVDAQEADIQLLCFALIMIMILMPAKKKVSPGAKPQSGFNVLLAIRRIHTVLGVMLVSLKYVRMTLRGLLQRFVRVHGHEALLPDRKWPLPFEVFIGLIQLRQVKFGATVWHADSLFGLSTIAALCLLYASGFRKAEITDHGAGLSYLTRSSVIWIIGGQRYKSPNAAVLMSAGQGDYAEVWPRQSKCDFTGEVWGAFATFHHFSTEEGNAFRALRALEIERPVHGDARVTFPLFCEDDGSPVSETRAARLMDAMLLVIMPAAMATHYTWHSLRHSLATRLRKAGCPADKIMQFCRWQTIESLRTYAQLDASQYRIWHEKSFGAVFTVGPSTENIDSGPTLAQLHDDDAWDQDEERPATPATGRGRGSPARGRGRSGGPLTRDNAAGRTVLVPAARYPRNTCAEHGGRGWEARVLSATGVTARVRYLNARSANGRPYEDTREPLTLLEPLD